MGNFLGVWDIKKAVDRIVSYQYRCPRGLLKNDSAFKWMVNSNKRLSNEATLLREEIIQLKKQRSINYLKHVKTDTKLKFICDYLHGIVSYPLPIRIRKIITDVATQSNKKKG